MSRRRWVWIGGAVAALGGGAFALARTMLPEKGAEAEHGARPRATYGPLVSDEQWRADQEWVAAGLRRERITADWTTEVFDRGEGEPMLCIPIVAHVEVIYARQVREFARDHRVITYRRPEGQDRPIMLADRAEEIRQLLDHLGIERVHIVARSEGAMVAAEFIRRYPERVRSAVLITIAMDYNVAPLWLTDVKNWLMLHFPPAAMLVTDDAVRHEVVSYLSGEDQRLTYDQLMEVYRNIPDFKKMYKYSAAPLLVYHDLRGKAQRLPPPTLLIGSEEDPRATRADLEELAAALPDCRGLHMLPHGGHFVNYVQGDEVNQLMRGFYERLSADSRQPSAVGSEQSAVS
ncbi:MAG TPA: alpha/beta hydrolase [Thermomicrobiales bacterium]|nr:alpha/beta hydrolase [Thermomicrobiales bacterium]